MLKIQKQFLVLFLAFVLAFCMSDTQTPNKNAVKQQTAEMGFFFSKINDYVTGSISMKNKGMAVHYFELDTDFNKKKYLFININSHNVLKNLSISIFDQATRKHIKTCNFGQYDECYIASSYLSQKEKIAMIIGAENEGTYNLQTSWGDLQHIEIDKPLKFIFGQQTSQLFHLQFAKSQKQLPQQIRIVLSPQTEPMQFDKLKIFAKFGVQNVPTQTQYDKKSLRVWGNSQAIFFDKKQIQQQAGVSIYIVGNSKTIYNLECQAINQKNHDLEINEVIHQFLQAEKSYIYHISTKDLDSPNFDQYSFKFSVFSGHLALGVFLDKDCTEQFPIKPFQYMSDQQYIIAKDQLINKYKDLYIKVGSGQALCIYKFELQGRRQNFVYQVSQDIYDFVLLKPNQKKAMYFYYPIINNQQNSNNKYIFEAKEINVHGEYALDFYICKNWTKCLQINDQKQFSENTKHIKDQKKQLGEKIIHNLRIKQSDFLDDLGYEKQAMLLAVFNNQKKGSQYAAAALQFSNPNKIKQIRQDKASQQYINRNQYKIFKFVNNDPEVSSVKIHYNHISGKTKIKSTRIDPKDKQNIVKGQNQYQSSQFMQFDQNLTEPIYIIVKGVSKSMFILTPLVQHKKHPYSAALTLAQDIPYNLKIKPYDSIIIQIHPIQQYVRFNYRSNDGPIYICKTDFYGKCLNDDKYSVNQKSKGSLNIISNKQRSIHLKIANGFNPLAEIPLTDKLMPKLVNLNIIYYDQIQQHCQIKSENILYFEPLKSGTCMKFNLPALNNIQIIAQQNSIGKDFLMITVCSQLVQKNFVNNRLLISKTQLQEKCQNQNQTTLSLFPIDQTRGHNTMIDFKYAVMYSHMSLTLQDGVSYSQRGHIKSKSEPLKTFEYQIKDTNINHTILVSNKKGQQIVIGKIIKNSQKYENTYLKYADSDFRINKGQQQLVLNQSYINSLKQCKKDCRILLSVYSQAKVGDQYNFRIEIMTSSERLAQTNAVTKYINKGNLKYYQYQMKSNNSTLFIKTSTNNLQCTKIFISKKQYPSENNNFQYSGNGELILEKLASDIYFIGVQALDDCEYTLTVSESKAGLSRLKYNQLYDLKLEKDQIKYFLIKHQSQQSLKILTLQNHGTIEFYAQKVDLSQSILAEIENGAYDYRKMKIKSQQQRNTLIISKNDDQFCSNCSYLVAVKALQQTDSSIILIAYNSEIPLTIKKQLFDKLSDTSEKTVVNFRQISSGNMSVNIISGKISLTMKYNGQTQDFNFTTKRKTIQEYKFEKVPQSQQSIQIIISALQAPAVYTLKLNPQNQQNQINITPGRPSKLILINYQAQCFIGSLRRMNQSIYMTVAAQQTHKLSQLEIKAQLQGKDNQVKSTRTGNILSILLQGKSIFFNKPKQYRICLTLKDYDNLGVIIFQQENINILPSNEQRLIQSQSNKYLIYPNGDFFIDLFTCQGESQIKYGNRIDEIQNKKFNILQRVGIPGQNHAIKAQSRNPVYLQVNTSKATLSWIPFDIETERGLGYTRFNIGSLSYQDQFKKIGFNVGGVTKIKQTKAQVDNIIYTLFLTNSQKELQKAIMCQKIEDQNQKVIVSRRSSKQLGKNIKFSINKNAIKDKYNQEQILYFNVVADMTLIPPSIDGEISETQHYKFIYYESTRPAQLFQPTSIQQWDMGLFFLVLLISIGVLIALGCLFVEYIVPAIGRMRNSMFVEQNENKNQDLPVPPSSDRNNIVNNEAIQSTPQTQENMK